MPLRFAALFLFPLALFAQKDSVVSSMDTSVNPCVDFYNYACGTWRKTNPMPGDRARYGRFDKLREDNLAVLRGILEKAAAAKSDPIDRKLGDFYTACMDEKTVDAKGYTPVKPDLDRIAALSSKDTLPEELATLQSTGVSVLFGIGASPDFKNSSQMIANVQSGGLGLPDRDYYLATDAKSAATRKAYVAHLAKYFELTGDQPLVAARRAADAMIVETALATAQMDRVSRRNPDNTYHKLTRAELLALTPTFDWNRYLTAIAAPAFDSINVQDPKYVQAAVALLQSTDLTRLKSYLAARVIHTKAELFSTQFTAQAFRFNEAYLRGIAEPLPRWKRCVAAVDASLPDSLGRRYVEQAFGAEGKTRMLKMVQQLENALDRDIKELPWMTAATKKQALVKLHAITNKIGYPDKWRDYAAVEVRRDDYAGNMRRAVAAERVRRLAKIGQPTDKSEWFMTPPTVNASYSSTNNSINFPAGILQPPFFDKERDDAMNFGGIGAVIGHELTHGFDDQGRKFDGAGNLRDWWSPKDATEFERRATCIADLYSSFVATGDVHLNGRLTLGEDSADSGGVRIALMALLDTIDNRPQAKIDGFAPEQRFFLGYAQIWCQNVTPEESRRLALTDPHSPGQYRVNGVLSNSPEFRKAFGCKEGQPMVRENACRVW